MIRVAGALEERIKADTVVALKAGDKQRTQALRLLTAALKKERIDAGKTPDEAAEIVVLKRERKRRLEAAERYEEGLIVVYLPVELGDDALVAIVDETIAEMGAVTPKDMGKVMGAVMKKVAGRADGGLVNRLVRSRLGG